MLVAGHFRPVSIYNLKLGPYSLVGLVELVLSLGLYLSASSRVARKGRKYLTYSEEAVNVRLASLVELYIEVAILIVVNILLYYRPEDYVIEYIKVL